MQSLNRMLGKPWFKSFTAWGFIVITSAQTACKAGAFDAFPHGTWACHILLSAGFGLLVLGIRRALTNAQAPTAQ